MKLLYITNQIIGPGGLERVLSVKTRLLAEQFGYNVHIFGLNQTSDETFYSFSKEIVRHSAVVQTRSLKYLFQYFSAVSNVITQVNPDLICVCDDSVKGFLIPWILPQNIPIVFEKHASKKIMENRPDASLIRRELIKLYGRIMNIAARRFDKLIVLTSDNLNEWPGLKNLMVIPNPLPFGLERTSSLTNKKVLVVGNHGYQKGFDRLLEIWKMTRAEVQDWKLEIYGMFDNEKRHVKQAEMLGIQSSVSFFDPIQNIQEKYAETSIYAMTSRSEGFGMVLIEAMACGVPCIAFDCPCGPKDIINNNLDGYLIEDENLEEYSQKLIALMKDQDLRIRLGQNAKNTAGEYLPQKIVHQWDTLFKDLVHE